MKHVWCFIPLVDLGLFHWCALICACLLLTNCVLTLTEARWTTLSMKPRCSVHDDVLFSMALIDVFVWTVSVSFNLVINILLPVLWEFVHPELSFYYRLPWFKQGNCSCHDGLETFLSLLFQHGTMSTTCADDIYMMMMADIIYDSDASARELGCVCKSFYNITIVGFRFWGDFCICCYSCMLVGSTRFNAVTFSMFLCSRSYMSLTQRAEVPYCTLSVLGCCSQFLEWIFIILFWIVPGFMSCCCCVPREGVFILDFTMEGREENGGFRADHTSENLGFANDHVE